MAKLIQLYTDTNTAAITDYAHQLGFKGEAFGINQVGNTYDYMVYTFASKDTTAKHHTYLSYTWGQHGIHIPYSLINISYGTNSQTEFDALVSELKNLGATEYFYKDGDPYYHLYHYAGLNISIYQNNRGNGAKYTITIGGRYY